MSYSRSSYKSTSSSLRYGDGDTSSTYRSSRSSNIDDSSSSTSIRRSTRTSGLGDDDSTTTRISSITSRNISIDDDGDIGSSFRRSSRLSSRLSTDDDSLSTSRFASRTSRLTSQDDDDDARTSRLASRTSRLSQDEGDEPSTYKKSRFLKSSRLGSDSIDDDSSSYKTSRFTSRTTRVTSGLDDDDLGSSASRTAKKASLTGEESGRRSSGAYYGVDRQTSIGGRMHAMTPRASITEVAPEAYEDPKIKEAKKRRETVVKELIETEEDFCRDMQFIATTYLKQLENAKTPPELREQKESLFGCFKEISEFHNDVLLKGIQYYAKNPAKVGCTFLRLERDFDRHVRYCRDLPEAVKLLESGPLKAHFDSYSERIKDDKTVIEHIKLPIQRINDYQLLLKELLKYTQKLSEDTNDLEKALDLMQAIPQRASDLQYISNIEGYKGNLHKLGRLLKHDWFDVIDSDGNSNERFIFLFRGRMFITDVNSPKHQEQKSYNVKNILKLQSIDFDDVDDSTILIKSKEGESIPGLPLKLKAKSEDQKKQWLDELRGTRQMSFDSEDDPQIDESKILSDLSDEPLAKKAKPEETKEKVEEEEKPQLKREESTKETKRMLSTKQDTIEDVSESKTSEVSVTEMKSNDFEPHEDVLTANTDTYRSGSLTSVDDIQSITTVVAEDDSVYFTASSEVEGLPSKPSFKRNLHSCSEHEGEKAKLDCLLIGNPIPTVNWLKNNKMLEPSDRIETKVDGSKHTLLINDLKVDDAGLYTLAASNNEGKASSSATLNVIKGKKGVKPDSRPTSPGGSILPHPPEFKVKLKDTELMEGTTVRCELTIKGSPMPSIKFIKDGKELIPSDRVSWSFESREAFELILEHVTPEDAGEYRCLAINSLGRDETWGKISVTKDKVLFMGLEDEPEETDKNLLSAGSMSPRSKSPLFKWFKDGKEFEASERFQVQFDEPEDSIAMIFQHVTPEDAGLYTCVAATSSGKISCSAELTVQGMIHTLLKDPEPPTIKAHMTDVEVNEGATAMLEVKIDGYPKPKISWYREDVLIEAGGRYKFLYEDNESYTLVIKNAKREDAGKYKVVAENDLGTVETSGKLTVTSQPKFKKQMKPCDSVLLNETLCLEIEIEGEPQPEVKWFKDGQQLKKGDRIKFKDDSSDVHKIIIEKVKAEDAGNYSCVISNSMGQQSSSSAVAVNAQASFIQKLKSVEVFEEDDAELRVKVGGIPKPSVKYFKDKNEIKSDGSHYTISEDGNEYTLKISKTKKTDSGKYSCVVSNDFGSETCEGDLGVKVRKAKPNFINKMKDYEAKEGDEMIDFIVKFEGSPKPKIVWKHDGKELNEGSKGFEIVNDDNSSVLKIAKVSSEHSGKYTCEAVNNEGKAETSGDLTVNAPPKFTKKLEDLNVNEDEEVKLNVKVVGSPSPTVKWMKDGSELKIDKKHIKSYEEDSTSFTLVIDKSTSSDAGQYKVIAENVFGKVESSGNLGVSSKPRFVQGLSDKNANENEKVEFVVKTERQISKPKIKWFVDEKEIRDNDQRYRIESDEEDDTYKLIIKSASDELSGKYKCAAINGHGTAETSAKFNVFTKPKFIKGLSNIEANEGEKVSMTVKVAGSPPPEVKFSKGGKDVSTEATVIIKQPMEDEYCLEIENIHIVMEGEYECRLTNKAGEAFSSGVVVVNSKPKITRDLDDKEVAVHENTVFEVEITGKPTPEVQWFKDGKKVAGTERITMESKEVLFSMKLDDAKPEDGGLYSVKAINKVGETKSRDGKLTVKELKASGEPPVFSKKLQDSLAVTNDSARFEAQVTGTPKPKIIWFKDGEKIVPKGRISVNDEGDTQVLVIRDLQMGDNSVISCKAENDQGEAETKGKLTVQEPEAPKIQGLADLSVEENKPAKFEVEVTGIPKPIVTWFKDGIEVETSLISSDPDSNKHSLSIKKVSKDLIGNYLCKAKNVAGETEVKAKLGITGMKEGIPIFEQSLSESTAVEGYPAKMEVKVCGEPKPHVEWQKDGKPISSDDGHLKTFEQPDGTRTLVIDECKPEDAGKYTAVVSDVNGKAATSAPLIVRSKSDAPKPECKPKIIQSLQDVSVSVGEPMKLAAKLKSSPFPKIEWLQNGKPLTPSDNVIMSFDGEEAQLTIRECTPEHSGEYELKLVNPLGETATKAMGKVGADQQAGETSAPKIKKELKPCESVKIKEILKLQVQVDGEPKPEVKWFKDDKPLKEGDRIKFKDSGDLHEVIIEKVKPEDAGKYSCVVSNPIGQEKSLCDVAVNAPASFSQKMKNVEAKEGDKAELSVKVDGNPKPDVKFLKDKTEVKPDGKHIEISEDGNEIKLKINDVKKSDAGKYSCVVSNDLGKEICEADFGVKVKTLKPNFTKKLTNCEAKEGDEMIDFTVKFEGSPKPNIAWKHDGKELNEGSKGFEIVNDDNSSVLKIAKVSSEHSGKYTCEAVNNEGKAETSGDLTVNAPPKLIKKLEDLNVGEDEEVKLNVEVAGSPSPTVKWMKDGSELKIDKKHIKSIADVPNNSYTLVIDSFKDSDKGEYKVVAQNTFGKVESIGKLKNKADDQKKSGEPRFEHPLSGITAVEGYPAKMEVKVDGDLKPKIEWQKDGKPIEIDGGHFKTFTEPDGTQILLIDECKPSDAGKYTAKVSNANGESETSAPLTVTSKNDAPPPESKPKIIEGLKDTSAKIGEPLNLSAKLKANPFPDIQWTKDDKPLTPSDKNIISFDGEKAQLTILDCTPQDSGEYKLKLVNPLGETTSKAMGKVDSTGKTESSRPKFEKFLSESTAVEGYPAKMEVKVDGGPTSDVQWQKDGKPISTDDGHFKTYVEPDGTHSLVIDKCKLDDSGKYSAIVYDDANGKTETSAPLTVKSKTDAPPPKTKPKILEPLKDTSVNNGETLTLSARIEANPFPDIKWFLDGKPLVASDNVIMTFDGEKAQLSIRNCTPQQSGKYELKLSNPSGETTSSAMGNVGPSGKSLNEPKFEKSLGDLSGVVGYPVKMEVKVEGEPAPNITWQKDGKPISTDDGHFSIYTAPDGTHSLVIDKCKPDDAGKYSAIAKNANGKAETSAPLSIKTEAPPPVSKPKILEHLQDVTVNVGEMMTLSATIQANPFPDIKWFLDGKPITASDNIIMSFDGTKAQLTIRKCSADNSGQYELRLVNPSGEASSKAMGRVKSDGKLSSPPKFGTALSGVTAIEGYPAKMQVLVEGSPAPNITWLKDGKPISTDDGHYKSYVEPDGTHTLVIDKCKADDAGTYTALASSDAGKTETSAPLTVKSASDAPPPPSSPIFIQPLHDVSVSIGNTINFVAKIKANPYPEITWLLNGQPIVASDNVFMTFDGTYVQLTILTCDSSHKGLYELKLVNSLGEATSKAMGDVNEDRAAKFVQRLSDSDGCTSEPLKLTCRVIGCPEPVIEWYYNGIRIESGIRSGTNYIISKNGEVCSLVIESPTERNSGVYECRAKNLHGKDTCRSTVKLIDKTVKGECATFLKKLGDCEVREGQNASAKFTACVSGSPAPELKWFKNGEPYEPTLPKSHVEYNNKSGMIRLEIRNVDQSDLGEYRCEATNEHGSDNSIAQLQFYSLDDKFKRKPAGEQFGGYDAYKQGGIPAPLPDKPIILRMTDNDLTLSWIPSIPILPRVPVTYIVEWAKLPDGQWVTYRAGLKDTQCVVLGLTPLSDYRFQVKVENKHGVSDASPYVTAHRSKLRAASPSDFKPKGYEIEHPPLDKSAAAPRFLRKEEDTIYAIRGQPVTIEFWVYAHPDPTVTWSFKDQKVSTEGKYDTLQDRNGRICLFITRMTDSDVGMYSCNAVNEFGETSKQVKLLIAEPPVFHKRLEETTVCARRHVRLECTVTGVPTPQIKWFKDWQPIHESSRIKILWEAPDRATLFISNAITRDAGLYSCSASNLAGNASTSASIHVEESEMEYDQYSFGTHKLIRPKNKSIADYYDLGDELGRGTQGIVYHAVERESGKSYALKMMHGKDKEWSYMNSELDIMNQMGYHARLLRLWDAFSDSTHHSISLVTDLCGGGELVASILQRGTLTENEVAHYIRQILQGLEYLHFNNIAHFGLTIGDILVQKVDGNDIKIGDFGLTQRLIPGINYYLQFGHPEFVAPECVDKESVNISFDMWSVGIITYILFTGTSPFLGSNDKETIENIQAKNLNMSHERLSDISTEGRDFLSKLLEYNPTKRINVKDALQHPWLRRGDLPGDGNQLGCIENLRGYHNRWKNWYLNASVRRFYRRRPLHSCLTHPSKMIYPPNERYTPSPTPERDHRPKFVPSQFEVPDRTRPEYEVGDFHSDSHYQQGPDTYLLPYRDVDFPVRVRRYIKVAAMRSPSLASNLKEPYWGDSGVSVRERRKYDDMCCEKTADKKEMERFKMDLLRE